MKYEKPRPFVPLNEQLRIIRERHNISTNEENPLVDELTLLNYSYYTLINGYQRALEKSPNSEQFIDGISLNLLSSINFIETEISSSLLHSILIVEKMFKTSLQYEVSYSFGEKQQDYLNPSNYRKKKYGKSRIEVINFLLKLATGYIHGETDNPRKRVVDEYVSKSTKEYRKTGNVPPWILVNELTFSQVLYWYEILPTESKERVIKSFALSRFFANNADQLEFFKQSMMLIRDFRNGLAHGDVLNKISPRVDTNLGKLNTVFKGNEAIITNSEYNAGIGKHDLYALIMTLSIMLNYSPARIILVMNLKRFFSELDNLMRINEAPMRRLLGIPQNIFDRMDAITNSLDPNTK
ncbi:Abi family protein [Weissella confusa]|uniref:Abi family protein n=1 Tax=Weissella confusa TaxID=1583 RepID=A0AAE2S6G4_WEICO|nr:Abi family protein [Weissella confusa]MBJ7631638.1 Abi family protein [Weissella confusa]MBJ7644411.1 Abi family protein [Weissella confusa]